MVLFRLPRWVLVVLLVIGIVFVIAGIGMVATGAEGGWAGLIFFALCTAVFAAQLWPSLLLSQRPDTPDLLLRQFPGPVELHVPQRKTALILAGLIVFGGVSLWYLYKEPPGAFVAGLLWLCIAALILGLPFVVYQLVRGASLRLEHDGFRVKQPWRWRFVRWGDASAFDIGSTSLVEQIGGDWSTVVTYDDKNADENKISWFNRSIVGRNSHLPDT